MNACDRYDSLIDWYANIRGVTKYLSWWDIKAQIEAESAFNPKARSITGAMGLGQFMPATWKEWMGNEDPTNPEANIDAMCQYMKHLLERFGGDWDKALAAYNWGQGNLRKALAAYGDKWKDHLPLETANYIKKIRKIAKH